MKILIKICLLLSIAWQANGQGKGFNSPGNYMGYRPQYKDTLSIDFSKGKKIEFIYQWYDLFEKPDQFYETDFWNAFEANFKILKTTVTKLSLQDNVKYKIKLKTQSDRHFYIRGIVKYFQLEALRGNKSKSLEDKKLAISKMQDSLFQVAIQKNQTISVSERIKTSKHKEYQIKNNEFISQTQWQHIIEMNYEHWKVRFYLDDINDLKAFKSKDLKKIIRSKRETFMRKRLYRYHTNLQYKLVDGELKQRKNYQPRRMERTRHMSLNFYPQVGTSLIKGQFSADMGALLGMNFNHKQYSAIRIATRYQLKVFGQADLSNNRAVKYNGFLDAIMDVNVAKDYKREEWVGAGFGYLIHHEGSVYGDNTARIFLKYRSSKMWGIQPEFNYSFKEKKGFIGLGFYFSL